MIKILRILGLTLLPVINAIGESNSQPGTRRGPCEFVLKLSAVLFCLTEWDTFPGWLSCMKDGMNQFGFEYDQDYYLISGVKQGEQILACKKAANVLFNYLNRLQYARS